MDCDGREGPDSPAPSVGGDGKRRYYVAVDDGESDTVAAFRVSERQFEDLREGDLVTVRSTARLGRVRWIVRDEDI